MVCVAQSHGAFARSTFAAAALGAAATLACAGGGSPTRQLIYSEIAGTSSSVIPGARNDIGQQTLAHWTAIGGLAVRAEGDEWVVRGFTDLGDDLLWILVRGSGTTGSMFLQEGQPVEGGSDPAERWNAFVDQPPVTWNDSGDIAYGPRARGGITDGDDEKIGIFDGAAHTIVLTEGSPVTGLAHHCSALGNSIGSVQMLDDGQVSFGNTPLIGCDSAIYYPALFRQNVGIMQNNVTMVKTDVGEEVVTFFGHSSAAFSRDGKHYAIPVTTNNPNDAADRILLVDGAAAMRESSPVAPGSSMLAAEFSSVFYAPNNDLYVRGTALGGGGWAVRNGALLKKTGDAITPSLAETWTSLANFTGNAHGDYLLSGGTSNPDLGANTVLVLHPSSRGAGADPQVLVREGDPVDVNGDGQFNDNAYVNSISFAFINDARIVYFIGSLRNEAGTSLGDALQRIDAGAACAGDTDGSGAVDVDDLIAVILGWGPCPAPPTACPGDVNGSGAVDVDDLIGVILNWGPCD